MRWTLNQTEKWSALLRFAAKAALMINGILFALFSIWFSAMFFFRFSQFLWRVWFSHKW